MMMHIIIGLYVLMVFTVILQLYHFTQHTRKKANMLVRSHIIETHLSKGIGLSFVSMFIIVVLSIMLVFNN